MCRVCAPLTFIWRLPNRRWPRRRAHCEPCTVSADHRRRAAQNPGAAHPGRASGTNTSVHSAPSQILCARQAAHGRTATQKALTALPDEPHTGYRAARVDPGNFRKDQNRRGTASPTLPASNVDSTIDTTVPMLQRRPIAPRSRPAGFATVVDMTNRTGKTRVWGASRPTNASLHLYRYVGTLR
jgi:hypothetical protein